MNRWASAVRCEDSLGVVTSDGILDTSVDLLPWFVPVIRGNVSAGPAEYVERSFLLKVNVHGLALLSLDIRTREYVGRSFQGFLVLPRGHQFLCIVRHVCFYLVSEI